MEPWTLAQSLAFPVVVGIVLAALPFLAPSWRWTRRLRSYTEIIPTLPAGVLREAYEDDFFALSHMLLIYHRRSTLAKVLTWAMFASGVGTVAYFVTGTYVSVLPNDWILLIAGLPISALAGYSTITGRAFWERDRLIDPDALPEVQKQIEAADAKARAEAELAAKKKAEKEQRRAEKQEERRARRAPKGSR